MSERPLHPAVLRDVDLAAQPRSLVPPGYAKAQPAPEPVLTPQPDPWQEGYQAGLAQGRAEGLRQGREEGRPQGYEMGLAEGRKAGAQEVLDQARATREAAGVRMALLDRIARELPAQFGEQLTSRLQAAEDDMVALCFTVLCRILGDTHVQRAALGPQVRQAIHQACGADAAGLLSVHVHPGDLTRLQEDPELAEWLRGRGGTALPWVADDQVRLGGCLVHTTQGTLDARLETQLAALQEMLLTSRQTEGGQA